MALGIAALVAGCGGGDSGGNQAAGNNVTCGAGTVLDGTTCVLEDAGTGGTGGSGGATPDGGAATCGPGTVLQGDQCVASSDDEVVIADNLTVIDDAVAEGATVLSDQLRFPASSGADLLSKVPGDILVSGAGYGFLRRVVSVTESGTEVVVETEQASLADAVKTGSLSASIVPWGSNAGSTPYVFPNKMWRDASDSLSFGIDVSGEKVWEDPSIGASVTITSGYARFSPVLDLGVKLGWGGVEEFNAVATGTFEAELVVKAEVSGQLSQPYSKVIWEGEPQTFVQWIGVVPVVEVVRPSLEVGMEVTMQAEFSVEAGAGVYSTVSLGARYLNGQWTDVKSSDWGWHSVGPFFTQQASAEVRVYLRPKVEVKLYDVAGPWITIEPYGRLHAAFDGSQDPPVTWGLYAGVKSEFGGKVEVLDKLDLIRKALTSDHRTACLVQLG